MKARILIIGFICAFFTLKAQNTKNIYVYSLPNQIYDLPEKTINQTLCEISQEHLDTLIKYGFPDDILISKLDEHYEFDKKIMDKKLLEVIQKLENDTFFRKNRINDTLASLLESVPSRYLAIFLVTGYDIINYESNNIEYFTEDEINAVRQRQLLIALAHILLSGTFYEQLIYAIPSNYPSSKKKTYKPNLSIFSLVFDCRKKTIVFYKSESRAESPINFPVKEQILANMTEKITGLIKDKD